MADVSKLNGYNLRDDTARSQINTINNTTIPAINARIDNLSTGENLIENAHIVFAGDSNWNFSSAAMTAFLRLMPDCTGENIQTGGASWDNIYSQVTGYQGTPDVFLLNAGGNSINNNGITASNIGGILGAPDVRDHSTPDVSISANQTIFNYMKATFAYIRDNWPRCLIYVVIRANQPKKPRSAWYYWKFYEQQICQEWGVPVIDANNIMNMTYWNDTQIAIYNQSDGQHYTAEAYQRYLPGIAAMLQACAAVQFAEAPDTYFVPQAVINTSYSTTDIRNAYAMTKWVAQHCAPMYCAAWAAKGRAQAYMSAGTAASCRFDFEANYNDALEMDMRGYVWGTDRQMVVINESTYSSDTHQRLGSIMINRTMESYASLPDLKTLPDGVYTMLNAAAGSYNTAGDLPTASGGTLYVTGLRDPGYVGGYNRTYLYIRASNGDLYTGYNYNGGAITWLVK